MAPRRKDPGKQGGNASPRWSLFGRPAPVPSKCPDCGSGPVLRISYGLPARELQEKGRRGEIILGGCVVRTPRWYCKNCLHRWPEDPPGGLNGIPEWREKHIAEAGAEFAVLTTEATREPSAEEPVVENYWARRDGRKVFLVRFPWGKMRLEKRFHLAPSGGAPVYEVVGGWPPVGIDYNRSRHLAQLAALRFEHRPPV